MVRSAFVSSLLCVAFTGSLAASQPGELAPVPRAMSPVGGAKAGALADACPTFSWTAVQGARGYELVVYRIDRTTDDAVTGPPVVRKALPPGGSWTLDGACLSTGERYGWTVRAMVEAGVGPWSAPAIFRVRPELTPELIAAVVDALRERGVAIPSGAAAVTAAPPATTSLDASAASAEGEERGSVTAQSVSGGSAAIRGELSATSGETYGVVGVSHSAAGAGVAAMGVAGGADLILDGAVDGVTDAHVSQSFLDRPSGAAETFDFRNSGAGAMSLTVDGATVIHTGNLSQISATGPLTSLEVGQLHLAGNTISTGQPDIVLSNSGWVRMNNAIGSRGWFDLIEGYGLNTYGDTYLGFGGNDSIAIGGSLADTLQIGAIVTGATPLTFDGATPGSGKLALAVTDPTANRMITLPDVSGTVSLRTQVTFTPITATSVPAGTDITVEVAVFAADGPVSDHVIRYWYADAPDRGAGAHPNTGGSTCCLLYDATPIGESTHIVTAMLVPGDRGWIRLTARYNAAGTHYLRVEADSVVYTLALTWT